MSTSYKKYRVNSGGRIGSIRGLLLLASLAFALGAEPITWTLDDVTSLGTSITGSFVYDANTFTFSSIDITTSGGDVIPDETWTVEGKCCLTDAESLELVDTSAPNEAGANVLVLLFGVAPGEEFLTDAGGSLEIRDTQEGTCLYTDCTGFNGNTNYDVTGAVVSGSAIPEPTTLPLLTVIASMVIVMRKRSQDPQHSPKANAREHSRRARAPSGVAIAQSSPRQSNIHERSF
jgi:hypothetical protein